MWMEPQPWAIIGGAATPQQVQVLVPGIDELLRRPSPIGAMGVSKGAPIAWGSTHWKTTEKTAHPVIVGNDGGVWPSLTSILIWGLARVDGKLAWDEWKKNSLACHAAVYPDIWYGIWSGPDVYNSVLSRYPGKTYFNEALVGPDGANAANSLDGSPNGTDFPVMNMHQHSDPLNGVAKLLGIEFREEGVSLTPTLPLDAYSFNSPLIGVEKSIAGFKGQYNPSVAGTWTITLRLPAAEAKRLSHLEVNGTAQPLKRTVEGALEFRGDSMPGKPLHWAVRT
jgi:hypothetical protein